jgi:hypothetical protein
MQITIDIQKHQPLTGTASLDGHLPLAFGGWLELLRVVADLAGSPAEQRAPAEKLATRQAPGER